MKDALETGFWVGGRSDCCSEQGALDRLKECRDLDSCLAKIGLICVWHFCSGLKPENALGFCKELTEPILTLSYPPQFYESGIIKRSHKTHSCGLYYHRSVEGWESVGQVLLSANLDTQVHLLLTDPDPVLTYHLPKWILPIVFSYLVFKCVTFLSPWLNRSITKSCRSKHYVI